MVKQVITFPEFSGIRCLMMPYIQGDPGSVPQTYAPYSDIIESVFLKKGDLGFLTIDESSARQGQPHRGDRAKFGRAIHTEAGKHPDNFTYRWAWGRSGVVSLDRGVKILLANNLEGSCALWDAEHEDTSIDGDIGHVADQYPYDAATLMKVGEVHEIGILTPHESLPVTQDFKRQFLRIISSGVHGREEYFTENPLVGFA
ncbi:MAG: hypothetical protein RL292_623 [Candidatus Parcubacteria bacterium]